MCLKEGWRCLKPEARKNWRNQKELALRIALPDRAAAATRRLGTWERICPSPVGLTSGNHANVPFARIAEGCLVNGKVRFANSARVSEVLER